MSRFEVRAAWVIGVLLPLLETMRRRTNFSEFAFYIDDYIAGGILLAAAWAVNARRPYGPAMLVGAWGILCGGLYPSFWGQVLSKEPIDVSGLSTLVVAAIKGTLGLIALVALYRSVRAVST